MPFAGYVIRRNDVRGGQDDAGHRFRGYKCYISMNYSVLEIPTGSEKKEGVLEMLTRLETLHNI